MSFFPPVKPHTGKRLAVHVFGTPDDRRPLRPEKT